jgi:glycosyltransferase involved in cell wall biosynthesis
MSNEQSRLLALVYAGLPPPVGGVASIVQMLHANLFRRNDILFSAPLPKRGGFLAGVLRPLLNFLGVVRSTLNIRRGGRVLMFASAGFSFYEKLIWSACIQMTGRKPVLALVDGNFPAFWQRQLPVLQALARYCMAQQSMRLGVQSQIWLDFYSGIFPKADFTVFAATVAPDFWQPFPKPQLDIMRVLYVGWLIPEKGIVDLLDAFTEVVSRLPDAQLRLVGPLFDKQSYWKEELASRGLMEKVDVIGPISARNELVQELRCTTLFVFPSHAEGLPVALLEAMAMGVACIASDVGAIADVLDQGRAGCIVPARSPDKLAAEIIRLLSDKDARGRLASAAFSRVSTHYSTEAFVASYLQLLDLQ